MKPKAYFTPLAAARLVLAAACILLTAACSQETDDIIPSDAPDGAVPFTFTAMAPPAMTTRAVEGMKTWAVGDQITVKLVKVATNMPSTGTYTIVDPETGAVEVRPGDRPALWQDRSNTSHKVYAWYPAIGSSTQVDISNQSTPKDFRNADLLRAYAENIPYGKPHKLVFSHQMAKVRVEVMGIDVSTTNTEVEVSGYSLLSLDANGVIVVDTLGINKISACPDENLSTTNVVAFEALMPPRSSKFLESQEFIHIQIGDKDYYFTPLAADRVQFEAGKFYTYTVTLPAATTTARHFVLPAAPIVTSFNNR